MNIGQPRVWSAIEITADHALGSALATPLRMLIFPIFGLNFTGSQHVKISILLFSLSLIRSFTSRRIFNAWHVFRYRWSMTPGE